MIKAKDIYTKEPFFQLCPESQIYVIENDDSSDKHQKNATLLNILNYSLKIIPTEDRSFLLFDLGAIIEQYDRLRKLMPRVHPFYAIKCMADKVIVSLLGSMGAGFDCASWDEIKNASLGLYKPMGSFPEKYHPVNGEKIVFSHPFKFGNEMVLSSKAGVEFTVFDTEEELKLIASNWPKAKLLIRLKPPKNIKAYAMLGNKFGALKSEIEDLLNVAKKLTLEIFGVSFHVGSGVEELDAWENCIEYAATIFEMLVEADFRPYVLDIGGGFPGMTMMGNEREENLNINKEFEKQCQRINATIDQHFPADDNYLVICEPGNYFMFGSGCIFLQVVGKQESKPGTVQYDINGEAYPEVKYTYIINNSMMHSVEYEAEIDFLSLKEYARNGKIVDIVNSETEEEKHPSRILGYTIDEHDCIKPLIHIPELQVGDWIVGFDKGAYTDVHNDLTTIFSSSTAIPHYYCITKSAHRRLRQLMDDLATEPTNKLLNSVNRDSLAFKITKNCEIM